MYQRLPWNRTGVQDRFSNTEQTQGRTADTRIGEFRRKNKKMPSLEQNRGTRPSTTLNHTKQAAGCCGRGRGPVFVIGIGLREPNTLLGHIWAVALLTAQAHTHVPPPNPEMWAASCLFEHVSQRVT